MKSSVQAFKYQKNLLAARGRKNVFGIGEKQCPYGEGENASFYYEFCEHPLANMETVEELEAYPWPKIEWFDFSHTREKLERASQGGTKAVEIGPVGTVFETSWQMMGLTKMYMDLIDNPEFVSEVARRVSDFYGRAHDRRVGGYRHSRDLP